MKNFFAVARQVLPFFIVWQRLAGFRRYQLIPIRSNRSRAQSQSDDHQRETRYGLTLIEIMIALTMTLIVLGAMMTAFQFASEKMQAGRAVMELANRSNSAESMLRADLAACSVEPRPYAQTTFPAGYFELTEGPMRDSTTALSSNPIVQTSNYLGDIDDVLGLTIRSSGQPFRGRWNGAMIESPLAEVVWYTTAGNELDGNPNYISFTESVRVHRRQLLIAPSTITIPSGTTFPQLLDEATLAQVTDFFLRNDISARVVPGGDSAHFDVIANSLNDLAIRKNRFAHQHPTIDGSNVYQENFPNQLNRNYLVNFSNLEDIVLSDVAAFDLKVYSPNSLVNNEANLIITPSDPGFDPSNVATRQRTGAYVDLGHNGTGWFSGNANVNSQCFYEVNYLFDFLDLNSNGFADNNEHVENVFDTWTPYYESDGINQDRADDNIVDQGTDGLDNDNDNGVDDTGERETLPPYPNPVRGLEVTIRLVEKGTKQIHQTTIVHSFVPE